MRPRQVDMNPITWSGGFVTLHVSVSGRMPVLYSLTNSAASAVSLHILSPTHPEGPRLTWAYLPNAEMSRRHVLIALVQRYQESKPHGGRHK